MKTPLLWLLLSAIAIGHTCEDPWSPSDDANETKVVQVSFLVADAVEIAKDGDRVAVLAENLDPKREYGVVIVASEKAKWIEVHTQDKPFPPRVERPYKDTRFLIRGNPGQKFYVSIRGEDIPTWLEVTIAPTVEPDQPPPIDPKPPAPIDDLTALSRDLSQKMGDAKTASELKVALTAKVNELDALCKQNKCPTLDNAKKEVTATIDRTFLARSTPNKDWLRGWRDPISKAIAAKSFPTTATYVSAIRAVAEGL